MKQYIRAMALDRNSAKEHVKSYRKVVTDHVIECIVYKNTLGCYRHWVDELTAWIADVNNTQLKIKRNPPKFKQFEYKEFLFGLFGTTTTDVKGALLSYKANNTDYPDFEITKDLVLTAYGCSQDLAEAVCYLLATSKGKNDTSSEDVKNTILSVLDEYCQ